MNVHLPLHFQKSWTERDLTDPENWRFVRYRLRAYAYSNIGNGCLFEVDWGSKSFAPIDEDESHTDSDDDDSFDDAVDKEGSVNSNGNSSATSDECSWCSEQSEELQERLLELHDDMEDHESDSDSVLETDSDSESELECDEDIDRSFCDAPATYDPAGMFTNVNVTMHQSFGSILSKDQKAKALRSSTCKESVADGGSRTIKARAISVAVDLLAENKLCI